MGIKSEIQMHEDVYEGVFGTDLAKVEKFLRLIDIDEALGNGDVDFWASMMEDAFLRNS